MKKQTLKVIAAGFSLLGILLLHYPVFAFPKPMVVKLFEQLVDSLSDSSTSPHNPNLMIGPVKVMKNGRIGISIARDSTSAHLPGITGTLSVPFNTFYNKTTISIYRFDPTKQRFALWEKHTLAQLDPMQTAVMRFYRTPGSNYSFVTEKTFQGSDQFGIVLQSPQPESRYDDNKKLLTLTSPTHKKVKKQADLIITELTVRPTGSYCFPVIELKNVGGEVSDKAWHGTRTALVLYSRNKPTQNWRVFSRIPFPRLDPGKKLQRHNGSLRYTSEKAVDRSLYFKAIVDEGNTIIESNETNNTKKAFLPCNMRPLPTALPRLPIMK